MKNRWKSLLIGGIIACCIQQMQAQEIEKEGNRENELHHRFSFAIAHSYIPAANEANGEKTIFITPTLGLNYELWFNEKWAVGLHNDFIMQSFNIENADNKPAIKREFPVLTALVGIFKPCKHVAIFAGPGKEFEKNENFSVVKTGVEYGVELPKNFEVGFGLEYDTKINGYNSWLVGISISKNFFGHK